jgi:hypothetical protein
LLNPSIRSIVSRAYFNAPENGLVIYEAQRAIAGINIRAVSDISVLMKTADQVKSINPMNRITDTMPNALTVIVFPNIKVIAPVKTDIIILAGNRIIFSGIRKNASNDMVQPPPLFLVVFGDYALVNRHDFLCRLCSPATVKLHQNFIAEPYFQFADASVTAYSVM